MCDHLFVVTGGPGAGKSTLIEALARRGVGTMPEAGRAIIRDQVAIGGAALPWGDRALYTELMLGWELRSYHEAEAMAGPVVLDRGIPDVAGYLTLIGFEVPDHVEAAARRFRYNRKVFLAPYWEAIFTGDAERKQDKAEAEATARTVAATYVRLGYELVELPLAGVEARADFVMGWVGR
ncbi:ATPase [Pleomorphomonas diazotrophica]|uniref:ATPase n=1 Tax=Pleomorphomonas diazotrophica TaxID=1166257 RepID=A0A1I4W7J8_9HYPH|nr:AAA family ATPase [Pleomorphomonas diazotrophica]PKR87929.1 ATPase [Pleomorphomonas diazotrophica]SFN09413.1 Predicted ATPase [Pleomorphomonas diazotrophica]